MKIFLVEQVDPRVQEPVELGPHELEYNGQIVIVRADDKTRACAVARPFFDKICPMREGDARYFLATELSPDGKEEILTLAIGAS